MLMKLVCYQHLLIYFSMFHLNAEGAVQITEVITQMNLMVLS